MKDTLRICEQIIHLDQIRSIRSQNEIKSIFVCLIHDVSFVSSPFFFSFINKMSQLIRSIGEDGKRALDQFAKCVDDSKNIDSCYNILTQETLPAFTNPEQMTATAELAYGMNRAMRCTAEQGNDMKTCMETHMKALLQKYGAIPGASAAVPEQKIATVQNNDAPLDVGQPGNSFGDFSRAEPFGTDPPVMKTVPEQGNTNVMSGLPDPANNVLPKMDAMPPTSSGNYNMERGLATLPTEPALSELEQQIMSRGVPQATESPYETVSASELYKDLPARNPLASYPLKDLVGNTRSSFGSGGTASLEDDPRGVFFPPIQPLPNVPLDTRRYQYLMSLRQEQAELRNGSGYSKYSDCMNLPENNLLPALTGGATMN